MDEEAIRDVFREAGDIRIRRMFGGHGIYRDDLMFALVAGGELYVKVDADTVEEFRALGSRPFVHQARDRKPVAMSYWLMPESAFDSPEDAAHFADLALAAALRSKAKTIVKKRPAK